MIFLLKTILFHILHKVIDSIKQIKCFLHLEIAIYYNLGVTS